VKRRNFQDFTDRISHVDVRNSWGPINSVVLPFIATKVPFFDVLQILQEDAQNTGTEVNPPSPRELTEAPAGPLPAAVASVQVCELSGLTCELFGLSYELFGLSYSCEMAILIVNVKTRFSFDTRGLVGSTLYSIGFTLYSVGFTFFFGWFHTLLGWFHPLLG
jgi:hypothetical protein